VWRSFRGYFRESVADTNFHELDSIVMISSPDGERYANCQL
jgi:hypothetical protein